MDFTDCGQGIIETANTEDFVDINCSYAAFKTPLRTRADEDQLVDEVETGDGLCRTEPVVCAVKPNILMQLCDLHDTSWTSSLATPITGSNVSWTNLNTEERKVLLPCRDEAPIRRILFNCEDEQVFNKSTVAPSADPIPVDERGTWDKPRADSSEVLSLPVQSTPRSKQRTNDSITLTPALAQSLSPILGIDNHNKLSLPQSSILGRKRKRRVERQLKSTSPVSSRSAQHSVGGVDIPVAELPVEKMETNSRSSLDSRSHGQSARRNSEFTDLKRSTVSSTIIKQSACNSKSTSVPAWPVQECRSKSACLNYEFSTKHDELNNCTVPYSFKSGFTSLKSSGSNSLSIPAAEPTPRVTGTPNSPILGSGRLQTKSKAYLKKARGVSLPRSECGSQDVEQTCKNGVSEDLHCFTPAVPSDRIECIQSNDQAKDNSRSEQIRNSRLVMHPISLSPILGNTNNNYKLTSESRMRRSRLARKSREKSSQSTSTAYLSTSVTSVTSVTNAPALSNDTETERVKLINDRKKIDVDFSPVFSVPSGPITISTPLVAREQLANNSVHCANVAGNSSTISSPKSATTTSPANCPKVMLVTQPDELKKSPTSQSFNFTQDQQDFSFNTIDEICKVSELIASTEHENKLGELNSNKLNFVGTVKSTDDELPKLNTKHGESRIKLIRTNSSSRRSFLYPNMGTGVDKISIPPKLDVKDLCQYARLLEVVANIEPKFSDSKLNNVPNVSTGFVQLSKLKPEDCAEVDFSEKNIMPLARPVENVIPLAREIEKKELSRTRQTTASCSKGESNLLKKTLVNKQVRKNIHKKEVQIKVPITEFTNTQITCLVKDAKLLFQNEDFKWDVEPTSSCDKRSLSKRFRTSTYENIDLNKPSEFANDVIRNPEELIKSNISVENIAHICNETQNWPQSNAVVKKTYSITDEVVINAGDLINDIATHSSSFRNSDTTEANTSMASAKKCNTALLTGNKARTCSSDVSLLRSTDINTPKANTNKTEGFSTASGKKFNVCNAAVEKARTLFNDIDTSLLGSTSFDTPKANINLMQGFSTASGKKVDISEGAVLKARTLFNDIDTSLDTTDFDTPKANVNFMQGFSTASGKKVDISEGAVLKARTLFNDIDTSLDTTDFDTPKANVNLIQGFSTASGKKVDISEGAVFKARTLFNNIDTSLDTTDFDTPKANVNLIQGFSTASGKKVDISEGAVFKARTLFNNIDTSLDTTNFDTPKANVNFMQGFSTASGKKVDISEGAVFKARTLFNNIDTSLNTTDFDTPKANVNLIQGFSTASGKKVDISEGAVFKARTLFNNIDTSLDTTNFDTPKANVNFMQGFSTASGKKVDISEGAVFKARTLFNNIDTSLDTTDFDTPKANVNLIQGFSTASGKKVDISEGAVFKARTLFNNIDTSLDTTNFDTPKANVNLIQGFSTASGKKVDISEGAVFKARTLFNNIDTSLDTTDFDTPKANVNLMQGFSTASGKKVDISEGAVLRARTLFNNIDTSLDTTDFDTPKANVNLIQGFSTASGKKVDISEGAVFKARTLFNNIDTSLDTTDFDTPKANVNLMQGFSTASGKKVDISEGAVFKARTLFNNIDTSLDTTDFDTPKANVNLMQGFSTASGKKVDISEGAVFKARTLFNNIDTSLDTTDFDTPKANVNLMQGFSTASGKKVDISEGAVFKARTLFNNIDTSLDTTDFDTPKANVNFMQGFSTASGKKVDISEGAVFKARTLFNNIDTSLDTTDFDTPKANVNLMQGFSTASGKKVDISEGAVFKARTLFNNIDTSLDTTDFDTPKANVNFMQGFSTASGKKVDISEGAVFKARTLFNNIDTSLDTTDFDSPKANVNLMQGFSTASGKKFSISESSLKKAKNFLNDIEIPPFQMNFDTPKARSLQKNEGQAPTKHACVFATASGKEPDHISESALSDARNIFSDIRTKPFHGSDEVPVHLNQSGIEVINEIVGGVIKYPIGFVSASGKKTDTVSESSLSKARYMFTESKRTTPPLESIHTFPNIHKSPSKCPSSVSQDDMDITEVLEVTEALLAAEESGVPGWITTFTSSPSHLDDRTDAGKPMVDGVIDRKSPVFGQHDRFSSRRRRPRAKAVVPLATEATAVFKIPYKQQSGPNAIALPTDRNKKRSADFEFGTPFAKRHLPAEPPKPVESLQETGLSVEEVGELRIKALENQRLSVATKDRSLCRPCKGSQLLRKQQERQQTWRQYAGGRTPGKYTRVQLAKYGVREAVINVTAQNAAEFHFSAHDHYGPSVCRNNTSGVPVSDAAVLILDPEGRAGVDHVELALLSSPGVDPKLVPAGWVRNHYRWIVWKLAATERSFPQHFAARCLTPTTTLLQLKYRYDKEVDRCQRPAIRRIMEQDDPASRRMVLCVARVERAGGESHGFQLELTDGWYSVMGSLDPDLSRFVAKGLVCVGTKLMIQGAELVNCKDACYPLEASSEVSLKLNANATRRARWDTRLGFQANPGPLKLGLDSVLPSGGSVGRLDVYVARVYPTLYVESAEDGRRVTRSGVAESRAAALYDRRRQERIEVLYAKARAELCNEQDASKKASSSAKGKGRKLQENPSGSQLERMMEQSTDIGGAQELLSSDQLTEVMKHRQQSSEALLRNLEDRVKQKLDDEGGKRNVASLLKIRVMAVNGSVSSTAILSVWRAPEDFTTMLREGTTVSVRGVSASGFRGGNLQLTAGRQTRYQTLSLPNKSDHLVRSVTSLVDVSARDFCPLFGELDVVGVVVHISSSSNFHTVYLAGQQMALLGVAFWGGLKDSGFEELLKPGAVIAATNLQWRKGSSAQRIPCAYVFELTTFSRNPRQHYLQEALRDMNQVVLKNVESFVKSSSEKLSTLLRDTLPPSSSTHWSPGVPSTTNHPSSARQSAENSAEPPQVSSVDCKELSPAQQRLKRLSWYSEPPPLPPMCISASRKIGEYRAPSISTETVAVQETTVDAETDSLPLSLE